MKGNPQHSMTDSSNEEQDGQDVDENIQQSNSMNGIEAPDPNYVYYVDSLPRQEELNIIIEPVIHQIPTNRNPGSTRVFLPWEV
jgi:hypothetical protein